MNWIESLYRTYENCAESVGDPSDRVPLIPIAHIVQQTHIEISVNQDGIFQSARVDPLITIIPCTEASAGRTNAPEAHPLSDKLNYVAADFFLLTGVGEPKPSKTESHHEKYINLLTSWTNSPHTHPKLKAILKYLRSNEGRVLGDLCRAGIYPLETGQIPKKWSGDKTSIPAIYQSTNNRAPWDVFVRWRVFIPGDPEDRAFMDRTLWDMWISYYGDTPAKIGLCYTTGAEGRLAAQHPNRIRSIADRAKLISANDSSGFTFRGRFDDKTGDQACGVSFDVTQKAHNALRWLIARQGDRDQAIVAWALSGKNVPPLVESTDKLLDDREQEDFLGDDHEHSSSSLPHAEVAQDFALRLKKKIGGYRAELGNADKIVVIALDSATPGRMSITYYRELAASEFLDRIEQWHRDCAWFQNFGKDKKFVGAPAPKEIARLTYGKMIKSQERLQISDEVISSISKRLLPCIVDARPIPADIGRSAVKRAAARQSMNRWDWESLLGIACALYRKQNPDQNYSMSYDESRDTRDYLYGSLLAVADHIEERSLWLEVKNLEKSKRKIRDTNAAKLMQRFSQNPYDTWRSIRLQINPYISRLKSNRPGLHARLMARLDALHDRIGPGFTDTSPLSGEFLLGFHSLRKKLWHEATIHNDKDLSELNKALQDESDTE